MKNINTSRALEAGVRFARFLVASALLFAAGTAPALANAGMGLQVIFPPIVTVGQSGLAGNIDIQNTSTPDTLTVTLDTITLIPSCGGYSVVTCTMPDPGVLAINTPASGRAGSACAGVTFTTAPTGNPDGSYSFTPNVPVTLGVPGGPLDKCIIDFTFSVLKAPTIDANASVPGTQTLPGALVTGTASDTSLAAGFGTAFFVTVNKASPGISTTASAAVVAGGSIFDTATLSGGNNPTGTITVRLYGPNDAACALAPIFTNGKTVAGNGSYQSDAFVVNVVGTYRWIASYSGDANNNAVAGACNDANESVVVTADSPSLTTVSSPAIKLGGSVTDTATLLNGTLPTGSITFRLYGPNDANCTGTAVFTSSAVNVNGNGSYPSTPAFTPQAIGTYRWIASYSGDANNNPITGACNDANESVVVSQATPAIATTASAGDVVGVAVTDSATLSGGFNPTGTIVFRLYGPSGPVVCNAGNEVFASAPIAVNGNGIYGPSGSFTPTIAGTYRWIATYSGDANNAGIAGVCGAANETVVISKATPGLATVASAGGPIGLAVTDTATLSNGLSPTGTIIFRLFGPSATAVCSDANLVFASAAITVNGNGTYGPSGSFTPTTAGTYRWRATYSGDANNNAVTGACGAANETVVITPATPTISTAASAGGPIGTPLTDTATVSGGSNPTGSITFALYGPNNLTCTGSPIFTSTVALAAGSATSAPFTPVAAGVYRWTATYTGNANNNAVTHPCNSPNESATIGPSSPTIATLASAGGPLGTALSDTATLSGGTNPTGTITFNLYGPNDTTCTGAVIHMSTVAVAAGSATSTSFTPAAPGIYRWTASYSGDANNNAVTHPCNSANESATIGKSTPTITTLASAGGPIGTALSDTATVSGGTNPTGTITFNLYGPNDTTCTGAVIHTSTVALAAGSATSTSFTTAAAGVYRWTANYSGDANNNAVAHPCNAANESATITPSTLTLVTQTAPIAILGTSITDTATLSGGTNPTGTLTFRLYGPNDATCAGTPLFTSSAVTVNGNGSYVSTPSFTPPSAGTYRWIAAYGGDANHAAVSGACNDANETVTVTIPAPPPGGTVPVPTLSEWSLMLLALMMGAVAMASARRRRR